MRKIARACGVRSMATKILAAFAIALSLAAGCFDGSARAGGITFSIPASSMAPTLMIGDLFYTSAIDGIDSLRRGDVVVFLREDGTYFVKRIVGMPGETFQMIGGVPHIDGRPFAQKAIGEIPGEEWGGSSPMRILGETMPGGRTYRIGMIGRPETGDDTLPMKIPEGRFLVLGDNRQNSLDSRYPEFGMVAFSSITRKAERIYWSKNWSRIWLTVQ